MANYEFSQVSGDSPRCRLSRTVQICLGLSLLVLIASVVVAVAVIFLWPRSPLVWKGKPTTKHFSDIFLGRCLVYTQILRPEMRDQDCKKILSVFKSTFISKNPCNITREDYEPLLKLVNQTIPCDKTLFWSKSKHLAHQYTWIQGKMFTLEDTLLGYIADDLRWCGDPNTSDLNYDSCPDWRENCPNNTVTMFWKVISQKILLAVKVWKSLLRTKALRYMPEDFVTQLQNTHRALREESPCPFAEAACGVVQVMLNGSLSEPFYKNSTFGSVEVINLDPNKVHKVEAWVMQDIEATSSDSCLRPSINELKLIVNKRNITFACQNNYRPVKFIQCVKNPEHSSCRFNI